MCAVVVLLRLTSAIAVLCSLQDQALTDRDAVVSRLTAQLVGARLAAADAWFVHFSWPTCRTVLQRRRCVD